MRERKTFDFLLVFCLFISSKLIERVALELQIGEGRGHAVHHRPQNIQTHHHHYHPNIIVIRMSPINNHSIYAQIQAGFRRSRLYLLSPIPSKDECSSESLKEFVEVWVSTKRRVNIIDE